jgi:HSP20 family protein
MDETQNRLRRFFGEDFGFEPLRMSEPIGWVPSVEIFETNDELTLTAELPGMTKENLEVSFEDDLLTIRGEKKEEKKQENAEKRYLLWERAYGSFQRTFTLPRTIDAPKIAAEFKHGVLTIHLPKTAHAKEKGQKIEILAK